MGFILTHDHLKTGNDCLRHLAIMHVSRRDRKKKKSKNMVGHTLFSLFCVLSESQGGIWEGVGSHIVPLQLLEVSPPPPPPPHLRLGACCSCSGFLGGGCRCLLPSCNGGLGLQPGSS